MRKYRLSGKLTAGLVLLLLAVCLAANALGCSLFYFGGDFTDDGANLFLRDEDQNGADENKLYLVKPCPDCGGTHDHRPFEEAGTNECGVTVTATQGMSPTEKILAADPFVQTGIHEAEIATVLTGHWFLAVLLPRSVAFFEANVSVLGLLDLDDTEHIIASDDLIGLAQ